MTDNSLTTRPESRMEKIRSFVMSEQALERFTGMMGNNAIYYLNQVMIVVANSQKLQECEPGSILITAMRAASLRLSVDPAKGQAWIIPFKGKATFQLGYKGVYELAMRTNQYRFINVIKIYEGEEIIENRMTGNHTLGGKRTGDKVIAFMLYFQLFNGFEKTFVMTVPEIEAHAAKYSQSYTYQNSPWNDPVERPKMMAKTVLTNGLRKWGRFNEDDKVNLEEIEEERGWHDRLSEPIDGEFTAPAPVDEKKTMIDLGFEDAPVTDTSKNKPVEIVTPEPEALMAWPKATIEAVANKYQLAPKHAEGMMNLAGMKFETPVAELLQWCDEYREYRLQVNEQGKQIYTPAQAAELVAEAREMKAELVREREEDEKHE